MVQTPFQKESLPPALESGDRLNRYEFEHRLKQLSNRKARLERLYAELQTKTGKNL